MMIFGARLALSAAVACSLAACGGDDDEHNHGDGDGDSATPDAGELQADAGQPDAGPPESMPVTIQFEPMVGDEPFACGTTYAGLGAEDTDVSPQDFRVYVHDVRLRSAAGGWVPVALEDDGIWQYLGVALLDFEDFTGACTDGTPETNMNLRGTVPGGSYDGLSFRIGVPHDLNHADLIDSPAPLNLTGLWWGWNFGHIFLAVVTQAQITEPEPGTNSHYLHLGSIDCTGDAAGGEEVTCGRPNRPLIRLGGFDPESDVVVADFAAPIARSNLASEIGCHSFSQDPCVWPFEFVGLNWFTGSETPNTQRLFRVK